MQLPGVKGQQTRDFSFNFASTIATGGTAQLLLPEAKSRSLFIFCNNSDTAMYLEFGGARAHATLTSGVVTSVSIDNAGFNYTYPPVVDFLGGGNSGNPNIVGVGQVGYPSPGDGAYAPPRTDLSGQRPAKGTAVLASSGIAGSLITSITIEDGGAGYAAAPYVFIRNSLRDPAGVAIPSATSGMPIQANGGSIYINGPSCPTDAIAVFCATTGKAFYVMSMP